MSLSIVQSAARARNNTDGGTATIHWGGTPASGNLLIVLISLRDGSVPTPNTGWTEDSTHRVHSASTGHYTTVFYKYAGGSESTTPVVDTVSRQQWELAAWEISGVAGVYATDVVDWHLNAAALVNGDYPINSASFNTSTANQLILVAAHAEGPSAASMATISAGTVDATHNSTDADGFGSFDAALGGHQLVSASGTAVGYAVNNGPNGSYAQSAVVCLQSAAGSETSTVGLALSKVSFSATSAREETTQATIALAHVSFNIKVMREETTTVSLALGQVTIRASVFDLPPGGATYTFSTFGA